MFQKPDHLKRVLIPLAGIFIGAGIFLIPVYLEALGYFHLHETVLVFFAILGGCIAGALSGGSDNIGEKGLVAGLLSGLLVCFIIFILVLGFPRMVVDKTGLVLIGLLFWGLMSIVLYPTGGFLGVFLKKRFMRKKIGGI